MIGIRQLMYTLSVAREGSFTVASNRLNVSQSAVSDQVKNLEERIGFELFDRTGRGVQVTRKGQIYLHEAERVWTDILQLEELGRSLGESQNELLRVGIISGIAKSIVPTLPKSPRTQVNVQTTTTRTIYKKLADQELDIGFAIKSPIDLVPAGLEESELFSTELVLISAQSHPTLKSGEAVDFNDFCNDPLIIGDLSVGYGLAIIDAFGKRRVNPRISSIVDNVETIIAMVKCENGVALVPKVSLSGEDHLNVNFLNEDSQVRVLVSAYFHRENSFRFGQEYMSKFTKSGSAKVE